MSARVAEGSGTSPEKFHLYRFLFFGFLCFYKKFLQDFGGADDRTLVMKQLQGQYPEYEVELVGSEEDRETVVVSSFKFNGLS